MTQKVKHVVIFVFLSLVILNSAASAQDRETQALAQPARESPHRFFDSLNITLTGLEVAALLADGITTQHLLKADPTHRFTREGDPIARPFVYAGWPGQIAGGALFVSADVGLRYLLHRKDHHRIERMLPLVITAYGTAGAVHNMGLWDLAAAITCYDTGKC